MQYFKVIDDKFVYTNTVDNQFYHVKDKNKFGNEIDKIPITKDFEYKFLKAIESDKKVIYWEYKPFRIKYQKVDGFMDEYIPHYHVIFRDGDKLKINVFDVEEFDPIAIPLITEDELYAMSDEEAGAYMSLVDEEQNIINKYSSAKKYCLENGMDFFIIDSKGIKRFSNDLTKYN